MNGYLGMESHQITASQAASTREMARREGPESSKRAAASVTASGERQRQLDSVLQAVNDTPGQTSRDLVVYVHTEGRTRVLDRYQVARRLPELQRQGLIHSVEQEHGDKLWWPGAQPTQQEKLF